MDMRKMRTRASSGLPRPDLIQLEKIENLEVLQAKMRTRVRETFPDDPDVVSEILDMLGIEELEMELPGCEAQR